MSIEAILTIMSAAGEIAVLAFLLRGNMWRTLPLFCIYIAWALFGDVTGLYLTHILPAHTYYRYYIVEMAIDSIFLFTVLVELAWSVLRPIRASLPRKSLYILAALIALAGVVIWPLVGRAVPASFGPDSSLLFRLTETAAILRAGCFLVVASFSQVLSIGWRDRELQIATGFGFYSIISLIVAVLHSHQISSEQYHWLDITSSVSYLGTLFYWVLSFKAKEPERRDFTPQMRQLLLSMSGGARAARIERSAPPSKRSGKKEK